MFDNNVLKMSTPEFLTEATSVLVIDPREVSPKLANSGVDNGWWAHCGVLMPSKHILPLGNTTVLASYLTRVKKSLTDVLVNIAGYKIFPLLMPGVAALFKAETPYSIFHRDVP